jgi:hypothetical protein
LFLQITVFPQRGACRMITLQGDQWKDAQLVERWKQERKASIESSWKKNERLNFAPLLLGVPVAAAPDLSALASYEQAAELTQCESESLLDRAHRIEGRKGSQRTYRGSSRAEAHRVPDLIAHDGEQWILSPMANRAKAEHIAKSKRMYEQGLTKKAQRQIACGILGARLTAKTRGTNSTWLTSVVSAIAPIAARSSLTGFSRGSMTSFCLWLSPRAISSAFADSHCSRLMPVSRLASTKR